MLWYAQNDVTVTEREGYLVFSCISASFLCSVFVYVKTRKNIFKTLKTVFKHSFFQHSGAELSNAAWIAARASTKKLYLTSF